MREILFKAKRKDNGEWVEGLSTKMWEILHIQDSENENVAYEIETNTNCQYTGEKDKYHNKIWENDIIKNEKGDIGVVQWFEEHAAFMIWNKTKNCVCYLAENDFSKIEIVGNEFDNPELLEVE